VVRAKAVSWLKQETSDQVPLLLNRVVDPD
jgi:hypothetical protein